MDDEKKEEQKEPVAVGEKGAETPPPAAATEKATKEAAPSSPQKQKTERPKNCARCNKPIKRKTWYYRNGKYFCGKGCWKLSQKKAA